ncbi:hypothetical protein QBC39DRAFT_424091 [Podospora conica]|nr:hypothetical protein QBC39DRAFT_424091 [Schizothecium conicum]
MHTRTLDGLTELLQSLGLGAIPEHLASADLLHQPIDIFHVYLADALRELVGCEAQQAFDAIQPANSVGNGDLDIVLPKLKLVDGPPLQDLAADLAKKFPKHPLFVVPWNDGIHVRFFLSPKTLPLVVIPYILDREDGYGSFETAGTSKPDDHPHNKALIEFSSPNLGPEFRPDHLRSTFIGAFVANVYEAMGWHAVRINYLGDWGKHIGLLGLGWSQHCSEEELENHPDPFRLIHELYAKMEEELKPKLAAKKQKARDKLEGGAEEEADKEDAIFVDRDAAFQRLEEGDPTAIELWERLHRISKSYYTRTYDRVGVKFADSPGESLVCRNPEALARVETIIKEKGLSESTEDGLTVVNFANHDAARLGVATLRNKDGTTTYLLRDVAAVFDRLEDFNFDKLVYVVGEQEHHFRQLFKLVDLMGRPEVTQKLHHLSFSRGTKQWGDAKLLGDVLDRVQETFEALELDAVPPCLRDTSKLKTVAINNLIVQELNARNKSQTSGTNLAVLISPEGETGLSLQVIYARLCDAISELQRNLKASEYSPDAADLSALSEAPWIEVVRLLARYPTITSVAYKTLEPSGVLSYLFLIVEELGYCLEEEDDDDEGEGAKQDIDGATIAAENAARLRLYQATRQVLENGMRLLNLVPVY